MIVPITTEEDWIEHLSDLPCWAPPTHSMVVVAPHPDDEILGVGGLIAAQRAAGINVCVVAVTDGENAYAGADPKALGILRAGEQTAAVQRLGVPVSKIIRLRMPDSDLMRNIPELVTRLSSLVTVGTHLVAPWRGDFHPDHEACGIAAERVADAIGATLTSYFFWTWHRGVPALLTGLSLRSFPLSTSELRAKAEALRCHHSQLFQDLGGDAGHPILPPDLLGPAQRPFETFLTR